MNSVVVLMLLCFIGSGAWCKEEENVVIPEVVDEAKDGKNINILHKEQVEMKLSDQIRRILNHYKQADPVGIPGAPIPDPMGIPPMKHSFSVATMHFMNVNVRGLSKFRIKHVRTDLSALKVVAALTIEKLDVDGNYTMSTWISSSKGPFTVVLKNVFVEAQAGLAVEVDGKLRAQDINMDITFSDISMDFKNLGFMGSLFQGIINSVGTFLFDSIKPFILKEAYTKIREEINTNLDKHVGEHSFPNSISPLDMAIAEGRKKVRNMGFDPYQIQDYNHTIGIFHGELTHTWAKGLSSFYRVGNMDFNMENNTLLIALNIGTQKLTGNTQWQISVAGGILSRAGTATFTIEYLKAQINASQSLDTRKHPSLDDLQFDLGNIQVRCDGAGTLDYVVEAAVNILPNLLRYQIMDAIENPVKNRIQEVLNGINVEQVIDEKLPEIDNLENGFML